ncbi:hypothetical protein FHW96_003338 [Novosphingobium sp. SG751A]|nr:hypothetical protein [Novosphingobium sp. SG751A]
MDGNDALAEGNGGLSLRWLMLALLGLLGLMQIGLWAFLGLPLWWWLAGGGLGLAAIAGVARATGWGGHIGWRDLAVCAAVAMAVLLLGGEGRLTYANTDWQVRLAVLRDLTLNPWPFAYEVAGGPMVLRAPLGMYLGPALTGNAHAAEWALWAQNSLLLTLVLGAGSTLFDGGRAKAIGLAVFLGFSGMDIVGQALAGQPLNLHLEQWAGFQFSAHITQMFWVPQHGLAGWIFAAAYLAWRRGKAPRIVMAVMVPFLPLLSPLAAMGCVPFALHAYGRSLFSRDVIWAGLAAVAALPGLAYLVAAGDSVGASATPLPLHSYPIFILLEIGAYLLALRLRPSSGVYGAATAWIVVASLLLIPFGRVGGGMDFAMRASIPALAVLAVLIADILVQSKKDSAWGPAKRVALVGLTIGLATPIGEISRAIAWPHAPEVACGYYGVVPSGAATYVAPLARFLPVIRPGVVLRRPHDPASCWQGPWPDAVTGQNAQTHPGRG